MRITFAYNRCIVNSCTWHGLPQPPTQCCCGGAALALHPYQLARRCLTRPTSSQLPALSFNIHAHQQTGRTRASGAWARCWQGRLHCNLCGKTFPRLECMCRHAKCGLTGQAVTAHTVTITRPHLTAHSSPMRARCVQLHISLGGCMRGTLRACNLLIPGRPHCRHSAIWGSVGLCFPGWSVEARRSVDRRPAVFGNGLPTAMSIINY